MWQIERIEVLRNIRFGDDNLDGFGGRNDLVEVSYLVTARIELSATAGFTDNSGQHVDIFRRRARNGRFYRRPYLGRPDCPAALELVSKEAAAALSAAGAHESRDLGTISFRPDGATGPDHLYQAKLNAGLLDLNPV